MKARNSRVDRPQRNPQSRPLQLSIPSLVKPQAASEHLITLIMLHFRASGEQTGSLVKQKGPSIPGGWWRSGLAQ